MRLRSAVLRLLLLAALFPPAAAAAEVRVKDVARVQGVRENSLYGYGLIVGLNGTGDRSTASPFTPQTIASMLQRLGIAPAPALLAGLAFLLLFWEPLRTLLRDWWSDPDAGHGLLMGPLAGWLAWRRGFRPTQDGVPAGGQPGSALVLLVGATALRYLSGLAAELFTMRMSMLGALLGIIVFCWGWRQLTFWWLPISLLVLSVPLPDVLLNSLAFPLQLQASQGGAALLEWRSVPVRLAGNIIQLPGQTLFVTEACSGLRSLTALVALGTLVAGLWLKRPWTRILLVLEAIPVAMALNAVRIFLTGFLVYYVSPSLGEGFMHYSEGWVIFVVAFGALAASAWLLARLEGTRRGAAESRA